MKAGPSQGLADTAGHHGNNNGITDLSALITLLITEIRVTMNEKIEMLNEKITNQHEENMRLKEIIKSQEKQISELQAVQQAPKAKTTTLTTTLNTALQQEQTAHTPTTRPRGIKVHNLIFTCPDIGESDPKEYIENVILEKYHRRPTLNAVQRLINTRGQEQTLVPENTSRGMEKMEKSATSQNQSKLLVTFTSVWESRQIYHERVQALKNTGIYVSEDLYKDESYLFFNARQLKKRKIIVNTWTEEGQIYFIEKKGEMPKILQKTDEILKKLEISENETKLSGKIFDIKKQQTETQEILPNDTASDSSIHTTKQDTPKENRKATINKKRK